MPKTSIFRKISKIADLNVEIWKFNKIISRNSSNIEALKELGAIYHYIHEDRIAIRIYEKILQIDPKDSDVRAYLGYLYYEIGNMQKSVEELNSSLDLNPKNSFGYFLLGNSYSRLGLVKEAVRSYDMALLLGLDVYRAHMDFASKFEDMNRKHRALLEYKSAYEVGPKSRNLMLKIRELELNAMPTKIRI